MALKDKEAFYGRLDEEIQDLPETEGDPVKHERLVVIGFGIVVTL